nr:unnamed protein product [Callosobruchus analis]
MYVSTICWRSQLIGVTKKQLLHSRVYIVIVSDELVLKQYLQLTPKVVVLEPKALYVIAYVGYQGQLGMNISKCAADNLKKLWKQNHVLNVISQYPCSDQWGDRFYIYRAFKKVGENSWGAIVTHKMKDVLLDHRKIVNSLRQLNGFPLRVALFQRPPTMLAYVTKGLAESPVYRKDQWYYGMDGRVFLTFKQHLNFTIILDNCSSSAYYGYAFGQSNVTYTLGKIVREEADFAANSRFLEYYGRANYEYTTVITDDEICVIVPKAPKMPTWKSMMLCFKGNVWLANYLILVICSLFLCYLRKKTAWLEMYAIFFSVPVNLERTSRLFLSACMFYNIIVAGIFQGNFVSIFTQTRYSSDINTLEELDASGLNIMTSSLCSVFERNKTVFKRLLKKVIANPSDRPALEQAAVSRKVAAVERKSDAKVLITQYTTSHGDPLLHIMNECLKTSFVTYVALNNYLMKVVEGGFIEKWKFDVVDAMVTKKQQEAVAPNSPRILDITDVQIAFYVLFFGHCLGFISFVIEKYLFFKKCRRLQQHFML